MFNKIFQNLIPIPIGKKLGFEMNMYVPIFMGTCHDMMIWKRTVIEMLTYFFFFFQLKGKLSSMNIEVKLFLYYRKCKLLVITLKIVACK